MKAQGSGMSRVLMEGSFYPCRCVRVHPLVSSSARQRDGFKALRTQHQVEYRIATCSALASHVQYRLQHDTRRTQESSQHAALTLAQRGLPSKQ